jgi:hypothetical protein
MSMKKLILPLVAGLFVLASCKKDYTCTCTETEVKVKTTQGSSTATTTTDVTKNEARIKGVKKSTVITEDDCYSSVYEKTYTSGNQTINQTITTDCEITK